jgi:hypothetical protein
MKNAYDEILATALKRQHVCFGVQI